MLGQARARRIAALSYAATLLLNCGDSAVGRNMEHARKADRLRSRRELGQGFPHPAARWVSDRGLLVDTGNVTLARYEQLVSADFKEIEDLIPADGSILLVLRKGCLLSAALRETLASPIVPAAAKVGAVREIPVQYGGAVGPDLGALAAQAGLEVEAYIAAHSEVDYSVAFLGFQPGFPYLQGLPVNLQAPRRHTPRVRVAAGSIAIGGKYCGIYPTSGPGGWQIIGRTAAVLFESQRDSPALLMPGDRVRFVPS